MTARKSIKKDAPNDNTIMGNQLNIVHDEKAHAAGCGILKTDWQ
jgi:hypothetical protein